jgi:hypothetical protein
MYRFLFLIQLELQINSVKVLQSLIFLQNYRMLGRSTRLTLFIFLSSSLSVVHHVLAESHNLPEDAGAGGSKSSEEAAPPAGAGDDSKLSPAEILAAKGYFGVNF